MSVESLSEEKRTVFEQLCFSPAKTSKMCMWKKLSHVLKKIVLIIIADLLVIHDFRWFNLCKYYVNEVFFKYLND